MRHQKKYKRAVLLLTLLVGQAVGAEGLTVTVEHPNGSSWFNINGQRMLPNLFYGGYKLRGARPEETVFPPQIKLATAAGIQILSSEIEMPWKRDGKTDFSKTDLILGTMHAANPDAFMYVRFAVSSPPWWNEQHPEHRAVFADGTLGEGCLASEVWREEMFRNVERFIDYCEETHGDRIMVYQMGALETGEWFYPGSWAGKYRGFSPHTRTAFMEWAKAKYGSLEDVGKQWQQPGLTPDGFRVPTVEERSRTLNGDFRDSEKERFVIDFNQFQNEIVADTAVQIAGVVKAKTNRKKLVSTFFGYVFDLAGLPKGPSTSGHYAMERVLQCPDIDLLSSPISYGDRNHNGISSFMTLVDSMTLWDKLWMVEDDTRTWLCPDDSWPAVYGKTDTPQKSKWVHQRNFGHVIPRRLGMWQMDLVDDGWFNSESIWDYLGDLRNIYEKQMAFPKTFAPEVTVIVDTSGPFYLADSNKLTTPLISAFRTQLYRMGTPCSFYLMSDVVNGKAPLGKVNLFLGAWNLDSAERQVLTQRLQGRTAVWFHGSGYMNGSVSSATNMTQLTGFEFDTDSGSATLRLPPFKAGASERIFEPLDWETDKELKMSKTVGRDKVLTPRWVVKNDSEVRILGTYLDGKQAVARQMYQGFNSIYVGGLGLPASYLRELCRAEGVHIYVDSDDVVSADEHFLSVSASTAGEKTIRLPFAGTLTDLDSGKGYSIPDGQALVLPFLEGETRLFSIER